MENENKEIPIQLTEQGAVLVNFAQLHRSGDGIVAIHVDLGSKRPYIANTGFGDDEFPSITLAADKKTLNTSKTKPTESSTTIEFPEYKGWRIFSANVARYTLSLCLVSP